MSKPEQPYRPPPKWIDKILEHFCDSELLEEVMGDLHERYYQRVQKVGEEKTRRQYWRDALSYVRPSIFRRKNFYHLSTHQAMLRIHFILAWRTLIKKKLYTAINMSSLVVGLTGATLIFLYVQHELSFDQFHSKKDRVFRILERSEKLGISSAILPGIAKSFLEEIPGLEEVVRIAETSAVVAYEDQNHSEGEFWFADPGLLHTLDYTFIAGDATTALTEPSSVIITESTARRYFGDREAIGEVISYDHKVDLTVTGVIADIPANSHFTFDFLAPINNFEKVNPSTLNRWDNQGTYYFCLLSESAHIASIQQQIEEVILENNPMIDERVRDEIEELGMALNLQSLADIHLYSSDTTWDYAQKGNIAYVIGFSIIALLLLCIACFNFVNLTTANASQRAKEVGIKKTLGALRTQLIGQFYSETLLFTLAALVLSLLAAYHLLPYFNQIMNTPLSLSLSNGQLLLALLAMAGFVFILAGSYPALFLSRMQPIKNLQSLGTSQSMGAWLSSKIRLRHVLVVGQFGVAIALIISSFFVASQLRLMMESKLGFDEEQLLVISNPWDNDRIHRLEAFSQQVQQSSRIAGVASAQTPPVGHVTYNDYVTLVDQPEEESVLMGQVAVTANFMEVMHANLIDGRYFSAELSSDSATAVILNQTAVQKLGLKQPVGQFIRVNDDTTRQIIGVVEDIQYASKHEEAYPVVFYIDPSMNTGNIMVRTNPGDLSGTISTLQSTWEKLAPEWPFEYQFMDDRLQRMYQAELQIQQLVRVFTILTIFVSCLGLFGLATLTTERRIKEIGIRKVLGASVKQLVLLLSQDFTKWVVLAFVVACPLAYATVRYWLQNFAERITISWWVFGLAGLLSIVIAWLTISYQSVRAALANPVDSLRNE